jgi:ABC-type amino acid transport substrate-binding protein
MLTYKTILFFLIPVTLLLGFFLYKNQWTKKVDDSCLIVGTTPTFQPYEFIENGEVVGFEIDLIKEVAKRLNKKIVFKTVAFDTLLLEAQAGSIHVIASGMTPTEERAKKVIFTKPFIQNDPLVVITCKPNKVEQVSDLYEKEVLVNEGYVAEEYMLKIPEIKTQRLETIAEAFLALTNGRAYCFATALSVALPFMKQYGKDKFNIFHLNFSESYAMAVSNVHQELYSVIKKTVDAIYQDGTLEALKKKWNIDFNENDYK